ncbi:MAG: c-type cytochrome [Planctomycetes bacterium]|nr:c-type cytochrome [Planctomycetota bacterium]
MDLRKCTSVPSRGSLPTAIPLVAACLLTLPSPASPPVAPTEPLTAAEEREKFRLPAGYEIQLVAAEPEIQKPMNLAFDARGRLWVTHSVEYPFAPPPDAAPRDGLTVLSDFGPDGRARKAHRFAGDLSIPIGVLPLADGGDGTTAAIVWSLPHIWKLTDTDGDLVSDTREVLYGPFDFVDTHGDQNSFRMGLDGWIYACHGFRNDSKVRLRGAGPVVLEMQSGNTYRFKPDGSAIELVSRGQVNPFGMAFDALGNQFTADCHSRPLSLVLRGACYESFGKPHDGLGFGPSVTGHDHGSTGIAGVIIGESDALASGDRGSAFVGNVITNTVHRDRLAWRGSSPWVDAPEDFVTCDDWWFRPVDLQIGPDGAVYIADFYNCIIGHYEVDLHHPRRDRERGRIWRVMTTAKATGTPPDLSGLPVAGLVERLGAPTGTLRRLAFETLLARASQDEAVAQALDGAMRAMPSGTGETIAAGPIPTDAAAHRRALALRGLDRLGRCDAACLATAAADPAVIVRVHAAHLLAERASWGAADRDLVHRLLADGDPFVRRAAAAAAGRHPDVASVPLLARAWDAAETADVQLIHALRIALRDTLRGIDPAALATLDPGSGAEATSIWGRVADVAAVTGSADTAWFALTAARRHDLGPEVTARALAGVAERCGIERVDEAVAFARGSGPADRPFCALVEGWQRRGKSLERGTALGQWAEALAGETLAAAAAHGPAGDPQPLLVSLAAARQLGLTGLADPVATILADGRSSDEARIAAVETLLALDEPRGTAAAGGLVADGRLATGLRKGVAERLGSVRSPAAAAALVQALATAPEPLEQPVALAAAATPEGAALLVDAITAGKASARILQQPAVVERLEAVGVENLRPRLAELTDGLPPADEALRRLIDTVAARHAAGPVDPATGAAVFGRACAACHARGGVGARIGPQLDGIGQRGRDRLLEDLLDPSRHVDDAFRTTILQLTDGRVVTGLRLRDEGGDVVLADALGKELRIAAADIAATRVSRLSPMPNNVRELVGEENLPHLLAYLLESAAAAP